MNNLSDINLKDNEKKALAELKEKLTEKYPDAEIILFGSKVRGDDEEYSDIDVLLLLDREVDNKLRSKITDITYDIELDIDKLKQKHLSGEQEEA